MKRYILLIPILCLLVFCHSVKAEQATTMFIGSGSAASYPDITFWLNFEEKVLNPKLSELLEKSSLLPSDTLELTNAGIREDGR